MSQQKGPDGRYYEQFTIAQFPGSAIVENKFEYAQEMGMAYSVGTNVQDISSTQILQARFENPANSGKICYLTDRIFSNNRSGTDANLESEFFVNVTESLTGSTVVVPNNLKPGGPSSSTRFEWRTTSDILSGSVLSRILPINGVFDNIQIVRLVKPGDSFMYQIVGPSSGLTSSGARSSMTFIWYEVDENNG